MWSTPSLKEFRENKICVVKEFRVKFNMKRMTLKPNLAFNWVFYSGALVCKFKW